MSSSNSQPPIPPNPPSADSSESKPSAPILDGKKCDVCLLVRNLDHFGNSRSKPDGKLLSCKDCINQVHRIQREKRYGRLNELPPGQNDDILRNNRHHNRAFLKSFFHGTDYDVHGVTLHIPTNKDYTFILRRIPNTPLVEIRIQDLDQDIAFHGVDRLKENAVEDLCRILREYRLETSLATMRIAKFYIYSRP